MKVGVIVGRFQVPYLHAGHLYLIGTAIQECDKVIIIFGCTKGKVLNEKNPYSSEQRSDMINKVFPGLTYTEIEDMDSNDEWSKRIDHLVACRIYEPKDAILYHSRDSFKESYSGELTLKELPEIPGFSGTQLRNELKNKTNV